MKLYDYQLAPNPRRVRIFLAEKGITVPTVQVDLRAGEQFTPEFRAINPECTVPVLEFDDGRRIAEVIAICLYFELAHPEPALMGVGAQDRAIVADWHHRIERQGFWAIADAFRNSAPGLMGRALPGPDDYEQIPALAERGRARTARFFEMLDRHLAGRRFVASDRYTIADHHGARDGQLRLSDQPRDPGRLQPSAALARDRFGAPERRRLIAGSSSDRLAAACEELIFDRQCEWRLGGVTCSFAWRLTNGLIGQQQRGPICRHLRVLKRRQIYIDRRA
jgi:glutathione S-transferase